MKKTILLFMMLMACAGAFAQSEGSFSETFNKAFTALYSGEYSDAYDLFGEELKASPKNGLAWWGHSVCADQLEDLTEALSDIDKAIKYLPKDQKSNLAMCYTHRGKLYAEQGDNKHAISDLKKAQLIDPSYSASYNTLATVYANEGKYIEAEGELKQLLALEIDDPSDVNVELGNLSYSQGNYNQAISYYDKAIDYNGTNDKAYIGRFYAHFESGEYEPAVDDLLTTIGHDINLLNYSILQQLSVEADTKDIVFSKVKKLVDADPDNPIMPYLLANLYQQANQYPEAIKYMGISYQRDESKETLANIAETFRQAGDFETALTIDSALTKWEKEEEMKKPEEERESYGPSNNLLRMMEDMFYLGERENAIAEATNALKEFPNDEQLLLNRMWYSYYAGDYDQSISDINTILGNDNSGSTYYNMLGRTYERKGDAAAARAMYQKVADMDLESFDLEQQIAYAKLGMTDKMMEKYDAYIEENGDANDNHFYDLACMFAVAGNKSMAIDYMSKALKGGYRNFAHIEEDDDLDNIREEADFKNLVAMYKSLNQKERAEMRDSLKASGIKF